LSSYKYAGLPLTASMAMALIVEYLSNAQKPVRRSDLTRFVESRHVELGGIAVVNTQDRVMQAVRRLLDDGLITNPALGFYSLVKEMPNALGAAESDAVPADTFELTAELLVPEQSIGDGSEVVYVYFQDAERKLAGYENRSSWPCKVGYTTGSLTTRIIAQGLATSMAKLPVVGLVIKSDDARALERILHSALDLVECRIEDALGSE
jgi:hypothetical protein